MEFPDFKIKNNGPLSVLCLDLGLQNFRVVLDYIRDLPYKRISDKNDLSLVLKEKRGTCSTKHAFLAALAQENELYSLNLMLGIFQMNEANTPGVGRILEKHQLEYIPEAHNYLNFKGARIDVTGLNASFISPFESLVFETKIQPRQIGDYKLQMHQSFLSEWLEKEQIPFTLDQIWQIRETCILALSDKTGNHE